MAEKALALRLAAVPICERSIGWQSDATIELRRLHAVEKQRDELLAELRRIATVNAMDYEYQAWARAAIAKAEGKV